MSNRKQKQPTSSSRSSELPRPLVAPIIAAIATIVAALLLYASTIRQTLLPIEATQTAEALNTSVAMTSQAQLPMETFTLTPSLIPDSPSLDFTASLPPALATPESYEISRGLTARCFDARYWHPQYAQALSTDSNNCWLLHGWNVVPQEEGFRVFISPADDTVAHWINTDIQTNAKISFTINVSELKTIDGVFGSIVFGFGNSSGNFLTGKFLIYRVINAASRIIYIYFGDPIKPTDEPLPQVGIYTKGTDQKVTLIIDELSLEIYFGESLVFGPISLSTNERELFWLGYTIPKSGLLDASVSDFAIRNLEP